MYGVMINNEYLWEDVFENLQDAICFITEYYTAHQCNGEVQIVELKPCRTTRIEVKFVLDVIED